MTQHHGKLQLHTGTDYIHIYDGGDHDHSENPWAIVPTQKIGQKIINAVNVRDELFQTVVLLYGFIYASEKMFKAIPEHLQPYPILKLAEEAMANAKAMP